jgi:hypothetical protein
MMAVRIYRYRNLCFIRQKEPQLITSVDNFFVNVAPFFQTIFIKNHVPSILLFAFDSIDLFCCGRLPTASAAA